MLTESYSYEYKIPKSREKRIYDFYLLTLYNQFMVLPTYEKRLQTLPGMDEDTRLDLEEIVASGAQELTDEMREDLLDAMVTSVASEFRHITDINDHREISEFMKKRGALDQFSRWMRKYNAHLQQVRTLDPAWDRKDGSRNKGTTIEYEAAYRAVGKSEWPVDQFMDVAADAFKTLDWRSKFGGDAWANIAKAWHGLKGAQSLKEKQQWIDRVIDLEHNTGTMLNKVQRFSKSQSKDPDKKRREKTLGFGWIKKALDAKFEMTPIQLARKSSLPMSLVGRLNRLTGAMETSVEDHDKQKKQEKYEREYPNELGPIRVKLINRVDSYIILVPDRYRNEDLVNKGFSLTDNAIGIYVNHRTNNVEKAWRLDDKNVDEGLKRIFNDTALIPGIRKALVIQAKKLKQHDKKTQKVKIGGLEATAFLRGSNIVVVLPKSMGDECERLYLSKPSGAWGVHKVPLGAGEHQILDSTILTYSSLDKLNEWGFTTDQEELRKDLYQIIYAFYPDEMISDKIIKFGNIVPMLKASSNSDSIVLKPMMASNPLRSLRITHDTMVIMYRQDISGDDASVLLRHKDTVEYSVARMLQIIAESRKFEKKDVDAAVATVYELAKEVQGAKSKKSDKNNEKLGTMKDVFTISEKGPLHVKYIPQGELGHLKSITIDAHKIVIHDNDSKKETFYPSNTSGIKRHIAKLISNDEKMVRRIVRFIVNQAYNFTASSNIGNEKYYEVTLGNKQYRAHWRNKVKIMIFTPVRESRELSRIAISPAGIVMRYFVDGFEGLHSKKAFRFEDEKVKDILKYILEDKDLADKFYQDMIQFYRSMAG